MSPYAQLSGDILGITSIISSMSLSYRNLIFSMTWAYIHNYTDDLKHVGNYFISGLVYNIIY